VWRLPVFAERPATFADAEQLTSEHALIEFIDLSPDGKLLALSSNRRGNQDLWVLPAAGGEMTPLTTDPTPDWNPRWSPDGSEIVFYAFRSGNRDIWVMPSRGGPARQLTSHPSQDVRPTWSPDGREIAFTSQRTEGNGRWVMNAQGGAARFITEAGADSGAWSADGHALVVERRGNLYRVAKDGGEQKLLARIGEQAYSLRFSADGQSLYYCVITGPRDKHGFWKLSLASGDISRLTKLEGRRGSIGYDFAIGGHYLYFTWREDEGDIWVMDVATDIRK
jgi:Tol biopolymer transport system component